jgi:cell division protein FtsW (lipid II flippase)
LTHPPQPLPLPGRFLDAGRCLELLLTLLVGWSLVALAAPLALPGADMGLQQRYGRIEQPLSWDALADLWRLYAWTTMPQDLRATTLSRTAGYWLALLGAVGWLALQLARIGSACSAGLVLALWCALAWLLRPFQWPGVVWCYGLMLALGVSLLARAFASEPRPAARAPINGWTACVWPGWLALTGTGLLVLLDFGARGPIVPGGMAALPLKPGARYLGLNQADGLWLASGLLLAFACWGSLVVRTWVRLCNLLAELWQRRRGPLLLTPLALCIMLGLGWLGASEHRDFLGLAGLQGGGRPHISGELLRLGACAALAWFAYRSGEWQVSAPRARNSLYRLLLLLALCALGLIVSDDKGPLLVLALAIAVLLGAPLLQLASGWRSQGWVLATRRSAALLLAVMLAVAALGLWRTTLTDLLPRISRDAQARELLRASPFEARSPNLAQARWLMDATPTSGFGLARVPYCGARAHAGFSGCTLGSGAPLQMASDFAFVPLFATWGSLGASLLVFGTLLWLFVLPASMLAARRASDARNAADRLGLLPVWLVAVPALVAQAQIVVSVGASLGWSSLTGVTLPLLGYGVSALCASALAVGLAAHPQGSRD